MSGAAALTFCSQARATIVNLVAVGKDGWLFPIWDEVRHTDLKKVATVASVLNAGVEVLRKANIQVAFALTPIKSRIYRDLLPDDFKFSADPDRRYTVALDELRKAGAFVPDMLSPLVAFRAANPTEPVFFKGDTHWTGAAAQASAIDFGRGLAERLKMAPAPEGGMAIGAPVSVSWGKNDLAALLPAVDAIKYPIESYRVRQPQKAKSGASLLDEDKSDVALVGNSFMQPRLGFAFMLSNQIGRQMALDWKVHQFGPYATMLDYLGSEPFRSNRPKTIIWNLHETDMTAPCEFKDAWGENAMPAPVFLAKLAQLSGSR